MLHEVGLIAKYVWPESEPWFLVATNKMASNKATDSLLDEPL